MKNYNLEVVNQLDGILIKSESFEFTDKGRSEVKEKISEMQVSIKDADYLGASLDGFDAIKLMIKEKRNLIKEAAPADVVQSMSALIQDLRDIVKENDDIVFTLMQAESMAYIIKPILIVATIIFLCVVIFFQLR